MNRTTARTLAVCALAAIPTSALAEQTCHTFAVPGVYDVIYNGNSSTAVSVAAAAVNDCTGPARALELTCSLQSLYAATWASEARCDITLPNGVIVPTRLCRLADSYSQIATAKVRVALPAGISNADLTGLWSFRFPDSFNDSGGLAESRVSNIQVKVVTETVPGAHKTVTAVDGVSIAKTDPQTDTGAYGRSWVKIEGEPIVTGSGQYMRIDATGTAGAMGPNRPNDPPYNGPLTIAIYNQNGEVLAANGGNSLTFNFGASGPDKRDGSAGSMAAGPNFSGPLYVSFTPWALDQEFDYDSPSFPSYPQYLDRSYPPFGVRGQAPAIGHYDYTVRVQRGFEATNPDWPDLSTVYPGRPLSTYVTPAAPGEVRLVRFRLPGPIHRSAGDWLDIDTSHSPFAAVYANGTRNDIELALFDADGNLVAQDDDDGAGFSSALTFGAESPARPPASGVSTPLGLPFNGRDGADLPAGEYYLAAVVYNAAFSDGFGVSHAALATSVSQNIYVTISGQLTPITPCGPADVGMSGGVEGADGMLDNNDFIAFINLFFASDALADLGVQGGGPGTDGQFDNNDFISFINLFFAGCP